MRYLASEVAVDDQQSMFARRFVLMTGKGGVGKSTVVAALAVQAAKRGLRPLVVELGHRASMRSIFSVSDIGFSPRPVGAGVHAMSMDVELALLEYLVQHLPSRRMAKAVTRNRMLERLFKATPAVGEIVTLNKLRSLEAERDGGQPKWHPIFVDLDASGHARMFLELREVVGGILGSGPLRKVIEGAAQMFADPKLTVLSLVTTPDELPVTETIELHRQLASRNLVTFGTVFINRMPQRTMPPDAEQVLPLIGAAAEATGLRELQRDVVFARRWLEAQKRAQSQVERLRAYFDRSLVQLPLLGAARIDMKRLEQLGAAAVASETEGPQ